MKVLVAHPYQQHSYRLATALKKAGILDKYITTVYYKPHSLTYWITKFITGKFKIKAQARHCDFLRDDEVVLFSEIAGLFKLFCMHVPFLKRYHQNVKYYTADLFAKKVARYAIKHRADAVITYDDCSPLLFEILKEKAPHIVRILDMSSAAIPYLHQICEQDCKQTPAFAQRLRKERSSFWNKTVLQRSQREINAAMYFLIPSQFVARSLQMCGVNPAQFLQLPYGVDIAAFSQKKYPFATNRPLQFIYVGGVKQLKGMYYLLEAFKRIPHDKAVLTIVGSVNKQDNDLKPYLDHVRFTGPVLHDKIPVLLQQADVFVFPSLAEGLSLSSLEAAACGLSLIVSKNSGINDLVTEGQEGFVIPVQSVDAIVEKVNWFIEHPDRLEPMGRAARKIAETYTWDSYYKKAGQIIENVVKMHVAH